MTCLVYFKYVVTLFRSRHSLYLFNVYFISFKRLQAWARMFTSFYFISDLSSREPYRATYPWENTWSLFPRPPRGMLRRGAICGRMHLRPCTGVKEPGWPSESLGVRKHTDTQQEGPPLTRWQNIQNDEWGRLNWMNMNILSKTYQSTTFAKKYAYIKFICSQSNAAFPLHWV